MPAMVFSQDYESNVRELNQQIETAISNEDFDKASTLKKERDLYLQLKEAIVKEDFEKASLIKKELEGETEIDKSNVMNSSPEDCIVYFVSSKTVGDIGGKIYIDDSELEITMKRRTFTKLHLRSGRTIFRTNHYSTYVEKVLKSGEIYILEFSNVPCCSGFGKYPSLRFLNKEILNSKIERELKPVEGYVFKDDQVKNETLIKVFFKNNCKKCVVQMNGAEIIEGSNKKVIYEIGVPNEAYLLSFFALCRNKNLTFDNGGSFTDYVFVLNKLIEPNNGGFFMIKGGMTSESEIVQMNKKDFEKETNGFAVIKVNN